MQITARTIVARTLRRIGQLGAGQTPDPTDMKDSYDILNEMIDGWRADQLAIPATVHVLTPVTSGDNTVVLPPPNYPGPVSTLNKFSVIINDVEYPLELLEPRMFQAIGTKDSPGQPRFVRVNSQGSQTLLELFPVPSANMVLVSYVPTIMAEFATLDTVYDMVPGYVRAIRYNLAVELAPEFELPLDGIVAAKAAEHLADIRRNNIRPETIPTDAPSFTFHGGYNIHSDEF